MDPYDDIARFTVLHEYAKIVLQSDYNVASGMSTNCWGEDAGLIYGKNVILDLNGYTLSYAYLSDDGVWYENNYIEINCDNFEIRDSSAAGTGRVELRGIFFYPKQMTSHVIMRGGTFNCNIDLYMYFNTSGDAKFYLYNGVVNGYLQYTVDNDIPSLFHMEGGSVRELLFSSRNLSHSNYSITMELAPYIVGDFTKTDDDYKHIVARNLTAVAEYCAVSSSKLVSGAYNYNYGLVWEISAAELNKLSIPTDKIYYLWGRDKDGWYRYLDMYYVDGKLVMA